MEYEYNTRGLHSSSFYSRVLTKTQNMAVAANTELNTLWNIPKQNQYSKNDIPQHADKKAPYYQQPIYIYSNTHTKLIYSY